MTAPTKYRQVIWKYRSKSSPIHWITFEQPAEEVYIVLSWLQCTFGRTSKIWAFKQRLLAFDVNASDCTQQEGGRLKLRLVFNSDGVVVEVTIRRVERYDVVKIKSTESEAEHRVCLWLHRLWSSSQKQKRKTKPITTLNSGPCDLLVLPPLLPTPTI